MADESAVKEAVHTALTAVQAEFAELEQTAVSVCQELEGEGAVLGSSVISRLRALGGRIAKYAKSTFRLGVLRALAVASTHYLMDLQRVSSGYVVPDDANADAASAIMDDADAAAEEFATVLAGKLEADIPPIAEFNTAEDPQGGMVACRKSGPRSPCNRLAFVVNLLCNRAYKYKKFVFVESTVWPIEALCVRAFVFFTLFLCSRMRLR